MIPQSLPISQSVMNFIPPYFNICLVLLDSIAVARSTSMTVLGHIGKLDEAAHVVSIFKGARTTVMFYPRLPIIAMNTNMRALQLEDQMEV